MLTTDGINFSARSANDLGTSDEYAQLILTIKIDKIRTNFEI